jgi:hypothetical protein
MIYDFSRSAQPNRGGLAGMTDPAWNFRFALEIAPALAREERDINSS